MSHSYLIKKNGVILNVRCQLDKDLKEGDQSEFLYQFE